MRLDVQHAGIPPDGGVRIHAAKPCFQAEMALIQPGNQINAAIEPAIKREIRVAGIHILKIAVIHGDGNAIRPARIEIGSQIKAEERIAAFMRAGQFAIDRHRGHRIGGADFQIGDPGCFRQRPRINAFAAVVIRALLPIHSIPAMRQVHRHCFTLLLKIPALIERYRFSHSVVLLLS